MLFSYFVFRFVNVPHSLITNKRCDTMSTNLVPRALFSQLGAPALDPRFGFIHYLYFFRNVRFNLLV